MLQKEAAENVIVDGIEGDDITATIVLSSASTYRDFDEPDDIPLPPLGAFLGRCQVHTHMAAGRNSAVYRGELWDLRLPVAVKVLHPRRRMDRPALAAHLRNEFQILSQLHHHGIARLWDYRDDPDQPHLATEYVESVTLERLRNEHGGRITTKLIARIAAKTLEALICAWRQGFVHRDIKPENILFTPDGHVKLIDWGLAGLVGEELPKGPTIDANRFLGSPAYIAPETAIKNRPFDFRTDIYSLGATMYHVVTGRLPFNMRTPQQMVLAHIEKTPVPPFDFVQEQGMLRLSEVILRMMSKDPKDRYNQPEELYDELMRVQTEDSSGNSRFMRRIF